jgi:hypothetical protein
MFELVEPIATIAFTEVAAEAFWALGMRTWVLEQRLARGLEPHADRWQRLLQVRSRHSPERTAFPAPG